MVNDPNRAFRILYLILSGLILIMAAVLTTPAASSSELDEMAAPDKRLHFAGGLVIGALSAAFVRETLPTSVPAWKGAMVSLAPALVVAVGKELYDRQHRDSHTPEFRDALATILGGIVGVQLTFRF